MHKHQVRWCGLWTAALGAGRWGGGIQKRQGGSCPAITMLKAEGRKC